MNNHNKIFNNIFQQSYSHTNKAHARVNLIGEHTDYTGGYVLPCLLQYKTVVSVAENKTSKTYNAYSEVYGEKISFNDFIKSKNNQWIDYLKGCLFVFYDENKKLISEIKSTEAENLIYNQTIHGGMIPKIRTCINAVNNSVRGVVIIDGRRPHSILFELFSDQGAGTLIRK